MIWVHIGLTLANVFMLFAAWRAYDRIFELNQDAKIKVQEAETKAFEINRSAESVCQVAGELIEKHGLAMIADGVRRAMGGMRN